MTADRKRGAVSSGLEMVVTGGKKKSEAAEETKARKSAAKSQRKTITKRTRKTAAAPAPTAARKTTPEGWVQVGTYLEASVKTALKVYAAERDGNMNAIINEAVKKLLKSKGVSI